jgi:hypothetical protein
MNSINFSRNLIKGKIAETVFEQMIREEGKYTVIPFGYEHTMPTLAQYRNLVEIREVMDNISDAPDFVLISNDKKRILLVEVKYQNRFNLGQIKKSAEKLNKRWDVSWIFVATPVGFYCGTCKNICEDKVLAPLPAIWVDKKRQAEYIDLLNEFESIPKKFDHFPTHKITW